MPLTPKSCTLPTPPVYPLPLFGAGAGSAGSGGGTPSLRLTTTGSLVASPTPPV